MNMPIPESIPVPLATKTFLMRSSPRWIRGLDFLLSATKNPKVMATPAARAARLKVEYQPV
jgi:hypothetical protein